MFGNALGVAKDAERATALYELAWQLGHINAANNLGVMYMNDPDVADREKAKYWFRKGAEKGDQKAARNLRNL